MPLDEEKSPRDYFRERGRLAPQPTALIGTGSAVPIEAPLLLIDGVARAMPDPGCKTFSRMRITVLAFDGVGAARFLRGLRAAEPDADITVIGNTGDDFTPFGLHVCPDLDTVMYTLGGGISEEQGWGPGCMRPAWCVRAGRVQRGAQLVRPRRPGYRHAHSA